MNHEEWEKSVPQAITSDVLWKVQAYRLALYVSDLAWQDATKLMQDKRAMSLADQLYRAIGSVSANIAEGYGRGTPKDRAHFYEYALTSTRESRDWYYKARHVLGEEVVAHRLNLLTQILRLLQVMIPDQRGYLIKDESPVYEV